VDRTQLTQLGRALARLGIEHIGAYSPQARGRGERVNRTLQDRLVNELEWPLLPICGLGRLERRLGELGALLPVRLPGPRKESNVQKAR